MPDQKFAGAGWITVVSFLSKFWFKQYLKIITDFSHSLIVCIFEYEAVFVWKLLKLWYKCQTDCLIKQVQMTMNVP